MYNRNLGADLPLFDFFWKLVGNCCYFTSPNPHKVWLYKIIEAPTGLTKVKKVLNITELKYFQQDISRQISKWNAVFCIFRIWRISRHLDHYNNDQSTFRITEPVAWWARVWGLGAEKRSAVKLTHDVLCLLGYSLIITTCTASYYVSKMWINSAFTPKALKEIKKIRGS